MSIDNLKNQYLILAEKLTDQVFQLLQAGQDKEQILQILSQDDFKRIVLNDNDFKKSFDDLNKLYLKTLQDMDKYADITEETLLALTNANQSIFMTKLANDVATSLQGNLVRGVLAGLSKQDIMRGMNVDLRPDQIETLVTTALNNYSASINSIMADKLPENTTYVYRGPIDAKTRDICLEFAARSPLTRKEIEAIEPGSFLNRGGFNCRHQWTPQVRDTAFFFPDKAKSLAEDKGISIG